MNFESFDGMLLPWWAHTW